MTILGIDQFIIMVFGTAKAFCADYCALLPTDSVCFVSKKFNFSGVKFSEARTVEAKLSKRKTNHIIRDQKIQS